MDGGRVQKQLSEAVAKESKIWNPKLLRSSLEEGGDVIGAQQRDFAVRWMVEVHKRMDFYPDTFFLGVEILDRFLSTIKARSKYLKCIAVSCYLLAAKMKEEDDVLPTTQDMVRLSHCHCSVADLLRMERIVLDKLNWDINYTTPLDFLHMFHASLLSDARSQLVQLMAKMGVDLSRHMDSLVGFLQEVVCHHQLVSLTKGSTLALALLSLDLEMLLPEWLAVTVTLQNTVQVKSEQLIKCRELVSSHFIPRPPLTSNAVYPLTPKSKFRSPYEGRKQPSQSSRKKKSGKRMKVAHTEVEDIYDSIKQLYNEEWIATATAEGVAKVPLAAPAPPSCVQQLLKDAAASTVTCDLYHCESGNLVL